MSVTTLQIMVNLPYPSVTNKHKLKYLPKKHYWHTRGTPEPAKKEQQETTTQRLSKRQQGQRTDVKKEVFLQRGQSTVQVIYEEFLTNQSMYLTCWYL